MSKEKYTFTFRDIRKKFIIEKDEINEWYTIYHKLFLRRIAIPTAEPLTDIIEAIDYLRSFIKQHYEF